MKRFLVIFFTILSGISIVARDNINKSMVPSESASIDQGDTVVFYLSSIIISGNEVSFPVSIISDDTILSLDFSFRYNHFNLTYDSLANLTNYIIPISFYNNNDSTFRFTSYSNQSYQKDTSLVLLYFSMLNSQVNSTDFSSIKAYLNGELCSIKFITSFISGLETDKKKEENIRIYPNPAKTELNIEMPDNSSFQILRPDGIVISDNLTNADNSKYTLNLQNYNSGLYMVKIWNHQFSTTRKFLINK